ncbi:methyltransferase domain-containing protein [Trichocoleus sp. FACHB-262]|uniref:methyltransferase domain-containing protein n=1 Tax=Trichocoleus sp. FACHB-262 TaxID=2692869 RepID=UPI0016849694|nr:methyltransferase domain-containing protein [Trichocoleus sp. FACHB-262]MBD2124459.1 methyltransferase domain-containing protein [Trichocoleus sp. FACHB-262]
MLNFIKRAKNLVPSSSTSLASPEQNSASLSNPSASALAEPGLKLDSVNPGQVTTLANIDPVDSQGPEVEQKSFAKINRELIANNYLTGTGIEIGALNHPLYVPSNAQVKYVDRMSVPDLRTHYPELNAVNLVEVDIIDNGESLTTIAEASQDFVIANHFIEHCQNTIASLCSMLRVLKIGGVLYLAIPDKRYTFDCDRAVTPVEHILRDYEEGPEWSRRHHFEEWTRIVNKIQDDHEAEVQTSHLMAIDYSIHYHVWTQTEFLDLLLTMKKTLNLAFELELFCKNGDEMIVILRKSEA